MSTTLLSQSRAVASRSAARSRQPPPCFACGGRKNASSVSPTRRGGPKNNAYPATGEDFLRVMYPGILAPPSTCPNLNVRPRDPSTISDADRDLSCLRPPALEFVEQPKVGENGKVAVSQRVKYWYRLGRTHLKFYKDGMVKVWANHKERRRIERRLGSEWAKSTRLPIAAIWGGDKTVADFGVPVPPVITRREFQICLQAKRDMRRLIPFGLVLALFGEWTPLLVPLFGTSIIPETCRRPADQEKDLDAYAKRVQNFQRVENIEALVPGPGYNFREYINRRLVLWSDVLKCSPLTKLATRFPVRWNGTIYSLLGVDKAAAQRHLENLADTVLIVREGGFNKLSADDIREYSMRCGSLLFADMARNAREKQASPTSEAMRRRMAGALEHHTRLLLDFDWTRLAPEHAWRREEGVRIFEVRSIDSWAFRPDEYQRSRRW